MACITTAYVSDHNPPQADQDLTQLLEELFNKQENVGTTKGFRPTEKKRWPPLYPLRVRSNAPVEFAAQQFVVGVFREQDELAFELGARNGHLLAV